MSNEAYPIGQSAKCVIRPLSRSDTGRVVADTLQTHQEANNNDTETRREWMQKKNKSTASISSTISFCACIELYFETIRIALQIWQVWVKEKDHLQCL